VATRPSGCGCEVVACATYLTAQIHCNVERIEIEELDNTRASCATSIVVDMEQDVLDFTVVRVEELEHHLTCYIEWKAFDVDCWLRYRLVVALSRVWQVRSTTTLIESTTTYVMAQIERERHRESVCVCVCVCCAGTN
jgi:hypothetical protein